MQLHHRITVCGREEGKRENGCVCQELESVIGDLRAEKERLTIDRQAAEDAAVLAREQVMGKQRIVDELEVFQ